MENQEVYARRGSYATQGWVSREKAMVGQQDELEAFVMWCEESKEENSHAENRMEIEVQAKKNTQTYSDNVI